MKKVRPIDADALIADLEAFNRPLCDDYHMKGYVFDQIITDIRNQPTVDAIPVSWIQERADSWDKELKNACQEDAEIIKAIQYDYLKVIEEWRKENG